MLLRNAAKAGWLAPVLLGTAALLAGPAQAADAAAAGGALYVDCSSGKDGSGTQQDPIGSLAALNAIRLQPGAQVLFRRGSTCYGSFKPAAGSSGVAGRPIVVDAYGDASQPRPAIAAGCRTSRRDPDQVETAASKTPHGVSPYHSLCETDDGQVARAALHLENVEQWEINNIELSNDGLHEGNRVGLLVHLQDFGTGTHYRVNNVYVHHVHGYLENPSPAVSYKATGGVLFSVGRQKDPKTPEVRTRFDDVVVENSEIFHVDGIGLSNTSSWMCRPYGAPCGDFATASKGNEYTPSTGIVFRNNKIHDIGGDGLIVRTSTGSRIVSNLLYDIWMRAPKWSAGAWAINTDDALFQYNEVHHVRMREQLEPSDGMAFDADMGTWNTRFISNYSHDNSGGLMLLCACGKDGLGHEAKTYAALVDNNLSVNDGRRAILAQGSDRAIIQNNFVLVTAPGLSTPVIENVKYPTKSEVLMRNNVFLDAADQGKLWRTKNPEGDYDGITWTDNVFIGFAASQFADGKYRRGAVEDRVMPAAGQDPKALMQRWFESSGFVRNRYKEPSAPAAVK
jgi:hypothetical protein